MSDEKKIVVEIDPDSVTVDMAKEAERHNEISKVLRGVVSDLVLDQLTHCITDKDGNIIGDNRDPRIDPIPDISDPLYAYKLSKRAKQIAGLSGDLQKVGRLKSAPWQPLTGKQYAEHSKTINGMVAKLVTPEHLKLTPEDQAQGWSWPTIMHVQKPIDEDNEPSFEITADRHYREVSYLMHWLEAPTDNAIDLFNGYQAAVDQAMVDRVVDRHYRNIDYLTHFIGPHTAKPFIDPMIFGNMEYKPDLVMPLPVARDGSKKDLMVYPRRPHSLTAMYPGLAKMPVVLAPNKPDPEGDAYIDVLLAAVAQSYGLPVEFLSKIATQESGKPPKKE